MEKAEWGGVVVSWGGEGKLGWGCWMWGMNTTAGTALLQSCPVANSVTELSLSLFLSAPSYPNPSLAHGKFPPLTKSAVCMLRRVLGTLMYLLCSISILEVAIPPSWGERRELQIWNRMPVLHLGCRKYSRGIIPVHFRVGCCGTRRAVELPSWKWDKPQPLPLLSFAQQLFGVWLSFALVFAQICSKQGPQDSTAQ